MDLILKKEREKRWRQKNKEKSNSYTKANRLRHLEEYKEKAKQYRLKNGRGKTADLKRSYGITLEDKVNMWLKQDKLCSICNRELELDRKEKKLFANIDHDHETGQVRGILCQHCNRALGLFQDSAEVLFKAYLYLKEHANA